jgi:hypothetical protein
MRRPQPTRRAVLQGAGASLFLPKLAYFDEAALEESQSARRFLAIYTANGMSLPKAEHNIPEWHWYPQELGPDYTFPKSTEPLAPFRKKLTFLSGFHHPSGLKSDPHCCSDMWLTGARLYDPPPGTYNTISLDQVVAAHTKHQCRRPSLVLSVDQGVGYLSRSGTIAYDPTGRPIPAENDPRRIFDQLFRADHASMRDERTQLKRRVKLIDAVLEHSKDLSKKLGQTDHDKLDQYLTSLSEIEERLIASERWIDVPLKTQDHSRLDLDADKEADPGAYYRSIFDLIALAFDADITRSIAFMLTREDGMGISDTFPLKLGLSQTHHKLSHASDKTGQHDFARFDRFLSEQLHHLFTRLDSYPDTNGTLLDNTLVLYGTGASTTHKSSNLPHLIAGASNMGLTHGHHRRHEMERLSNLYLSILHSLGIPDTAFADSTGRLEDSLFTYA